MCSSKCDSRPVFNNVIDLILIKTNESNWINNSNFIVMGWFFYSKVLMRISAKMQIDCCESQSVQMRKSDDGSGSD